MRRFALLACAAIGACNDGVAADPGIDASLAVDNGTFVRGEMPGENGGPGVISTTLTSNTFRAGQVSRPFTGVLGNGATAVAIGLHGDRGYYIVPAGQPDISNRDLPTFDAPLSLARHARPGPATLVTRAVDRDGHFGPAHLDEIPITSTTIPSGALVIALRWDSDADLDLHVVLPDGSEIFKRRPHSDGGFLDFDSNASCRRDGLDGENVVFPTLAPSGHYLVRVDTFSMCAAPSAAWRLEAFANGRRLAEKAGFSTDVDTRFSHDRGSGVLALELDVP